MKKILMFLLIPIGLGKRILQKLGVIKPDISDEQLEELKNWGDKE